MQMRTPLLLTIGFGVATLAFGDGRLEEARKQFFDVSQRSYVDTVKYLESSDQNDAVKSAHQLHDNLDKLENPLLYIEKDIADVDSDLKSKWEPVMKTFGNLRTSCGLLEQKIGTGSTSSELSSLKDNFAKFGDELNKATEEFKKYGKKLDERSRKFYAMCESCK
jgi:hypothetical protein